MGMCVIRETNKCVVRSAWLHSVTAERRVPGASTVNNRALRTIFLEEPHERERSFS
jgi:hypothetical protein